MVNYWKIVRQVINNSDVLLLVLDARFVEQTRHEELEQVISNSGKKCIYVLSKCDLVAEGHLSYWKSKLKPCVFVSAHKHYGLTILKRMLLQYAKNKDIIVGIVGYPNTGKSSLINGLKGKKATRVSSYSGYTRFRQVVRLDSHILLIDTPGVLSYDNKSAEFKAIIGSLNPEQAKDPEDIALFMIDKFKKSIADHYGW